MTETATAPVNTPPLPKRDSAPPTPRKAVRRKPLVVPVEDDEDRPPGYVPPTSLMASFGVSMLLHLVVLVGLTFWMLGVKPPDLSLLIDGTNKVGIKTKLEDVEKISLEIDGGGQVQNPTELVAKQPIDRPTDDGKLPTSILESIQQLAAKDDGKGGKTGAGDGEGEATAPNGGAKTGNAVTRGSFTAWTVPENPKIREPYLIYIEVRLTEALLKKKADLKKRFPAKDLFGAVVGTDGYKQTIPWDRELPRLGDPRYVRHTYREDPRSKKGRLIWLSPVSRQPFLPVKDGVARLVIKVPGAPERKVEDTIKLESKLLNEKQTLKIVF